MCAETASSAETPSGSPDRALRFSPSLRFLLRALTWALLLFGFVRIPWVQRSLLLPFAGLQGRIGCALVGTEPSSVFVGLSCTGADPMALVLASVLAFPASLRHRLRGVALGLALILALNTVRIATLSLVVGDRPVFNFLHVYLWPALLIIAAAAYVFHWMGASLSGESKQTRPAAALSFSRQATFRFLSLLLAFVLAFYALAPWMMRSEAVLGVARWATVAAGAVMRTLGTPATVSGNYLETPNGLWVVTQSCVVTPLLPVYLAAVFMLPISRAARAIAAMAALPLFLLLGTARLLVLAIPASLLGSPEVAVHAFYQTLAAVLIVLAIAGLAGLHPSVMARAGLAARALATGVGCGVLGGLLLRAWAQPALIGSRDSLHLGHAYSDPQGALLLLPAFFVGLFVAIWAALRQPLRSPRFLVGLGLQLAVGAAIVVTAGELATHARFELPVAAVRAVTLVVPLAAAWWLSTRYARDASPSPVSISANTSLG
ncbi:MAG: hypothetical protein ACE5GX_14525 [Thermoanaerobaculia bacterium]